MSGTTFVEKGDPIHIVCNATGSVNPPQDLDWFKDGIKITPDAHQKITIEKFQSLPTKTIVSVLQLKHSNMNDAGTYVCRSSNLDITSIKVHVLNGKWVVWDCCFFISADINTQPDPVVTNIDLHLEMPCL